VSRKFAHRSELGSYSDAFELLLKLLVINLSRGLEVLAIPHRDAKGL
jgi:hypothetical protein